MKQIALTQGKVAFVDDEDYIMIMQYSWCYSTTKRGNYGYAKTRINSIKGPTTTFMHILIMKPNPLRLEIDHKDGDGLNNQKYNLRFATQSQQNRNASKERGNCSSKYKGVSFDKRRNIWRARINVNGLEIFLGSYPNEIAAAEMYDLAAKLYFGEFARFNFPDKPSEEVE